MSSLHLNLKVQALLDGHVSVDGSWTRDDFAALSVAAADQAGCSVREQMRIAAIVSVPETTLTTAADRHVEGSR